MSFFFLSFDLKDSGRKFELSFARASTMLFAFKKLILIAKPDECNYSTLCWKFFVEQVLSLIKDLDCVFTLLN